MLFVTQIAGFHVVVTSRSLGLKHFTNEGATLTVFDIIAELNGHKPMETASVSKQFGRRKLRPRTARKNSASINRN